MVAIKNFLLLAVSVSAAVLPGKRDAASVQAALNTVNSDINALTTAANNYNGGALNALTVQRAANTLNTDIKAATDTANGSAVVSDSEAASIIAYVTGTLRPGTASAIDAIIAKKAKFTADGLASTVSNTLKTTLTNVNSLADALIAKSPSSQNAAAQSAKTGIVSEVQRGVNAYA